MVDLIRLDLASPICPFRQSLLQISIASWWASDKPYAYGVLMGRFQHNCRISTSRARFTTMDAESRLMGDVIPVQKSRSASNGTESVRVKRKPVPATEEYELLNPSSTADTTRPANLRKPAPRNLSTLLSHWSAGWLWEVLSLLVAIACAASIVTVLAVVENKTTSFWPFDFSVNAVLSTLVTIMKGAVGICVAGGLSQMKWSWFRQERKLIDLVIIDDASRGAM